MTKEHSKGGKFSFLEPEDLTQAGYPAPYNSLPPSTPPPPLGVIYYLFGRKSEFESLRSDTFQSMLLL